MEHFWTKQFVLLLTSISTICLSFFKIVRIWIEWFFQNTTISYLMITKTKESSSDIILQ